ncbi:MAG: aspartate kinase [Candidatus Methanofastidiosia archaeon]
MIVVKFGGTSLENPKKIMHCAEIVKREVEKGETVTVVVSAQAGDTERLSKMAKKLKVSKDSADEIVSMGERISMRLMCAALNSQGIKSKFIDPNQEEWPIHTDSNHGFADIILKETKMRVLEVIQPLLEKGFVPVIGGFIGKSREEKITTLGRGGSDITGVLLGHCLLADVYIVTDVDGVFSADPKRVKSAKLIKEIRCEELWDLGIYGAKVMHPKALIYKTKDMKLKIVSNKNFLSERGTEIVGFLSSEVKVFCNEKEKSLVSVVGEEMSEIPGLLKKFSSALKDINIYSVSASTFSITFFVDSEREEDAVQALHKVVLGTPKLKAVSSRGGIALIVFRGRKFPQDVGVLGKIGMALGDAEIDILNIATSSCEANIFVEWKDRKLAKSILERIFEVGK